MNSDTLAAPSVANQSLINQRHEVIIADPPLARLLFSSTRLSWLWLIIRVYLGWQWLTAGWGKFNNPAWIQTGDALKGFWAGAVKLPATGKPPIAYDWYRDFIQLMLDQGWYTWFAKVITFGELAIGLALILGAFVGLAAFGGALLN